MTQVAEALIAAAVLAADPGIAASIALVAARA
jgi:hypothetical protein